MSANSLPKAAGELDELLSDFFKSQLKRPWPKAPVPESAARAEPSELAAVRAAEPPRNSPPAPARRRDNTARARYTLAASVALLLGTGWLLTDGLPPAGHLAPGPAANTPGNGFLPGSSADGKDHAPLKKMDEDKAKGNGGIKVDVGGIE